MFKTPKIQLSLESLRHLNCKQNAPDLGLILVEVGNQMFKITKRFVSYHQNKSESMVPSMSVKYLLFLGHVYLHIL